MTEFTPFQSLAGGVLIGLAAVGLMLAYGRIAGATGILTGIISSSDRSWRVAMLLGMVLAPGLMLLTTGDLPVIDVPVSASALAAGGFIVGLGVTFGSGCTSGHGVCGMARLSPRSIVATLTFMATTAATVYLARHVAGG